MKKIIIIAILAVLLTSCGYFQTTKKAADITGTAGLVITLPKLPKEVYTGQGLEIPIQLENGGTSKIENAILILSGYDDKIINFRTQPKIEGISLEGRSEMVPVGEKRTEIFTISSVNLPSAKQITQIIQAVACYPYKTEASPVVCINPQAAYGKTDIKTGCDFTDAQLSSSQGAPIAVTKVETWYFIDERQVEFRIFVKDVFGKGIVTNSATYGKRCLVSDSLGENDLNIISAEVYMSGQLLSCYSVTGTDPIEKFNLLQDSSIPVLRCRAKLDPNKAAFTTPLTIRLSYGYVQLDVFSLLIKNPAYVG